jgi:hypothetical protein
MNHPILKQRYDIADKGISPPMRGALNSHTRGPFSSFALFGKKESVNISLWYCSLMGWGLENPNGSLTFY